jgi:hypothetical protein
MVFSQLMPYFAPIHSGCLFAELSSVSAGSKTFPMAARDSDAIDQLLLNSFCVHDVDVDIVETATDYQVFAGHM